MAIFQDITERRNTEKQLSLLASVFSSALEGMVIIDLDNMIIDVNQAFSHITGYTKKDAVGQNFNFLNSLKQDQQFYKKMWQQIAQKGFWQGELYNNKKNGESYVELLTISSILDKKGVVSQYLGIFSDISLQKEQERELQNIAHYDLLTKLPNRLLFSDRLHVAIAHTHRKKAVMAIAYMDLDGFKAVNDRYGHKAGDELLQEVATRMKLTLRKEDTVSRFGGDEFVAILANLSQQEDVLPLLARLVESVAQPIELAEGQACISISIGVTFYPQNQTIGVDQLLRQADQAMYHAKTTGKNRYVMFHDV